MKQMSFFMLTTTTNPVIRSTGVLPMNMISSLNWAWPKSLVQPGLIRLEHLFF